MYCAKLFVSLSFLACLTLLSGCGEETKRDPHAKVNGLAYWIVDTAGNESDGSGGAVTLSASQNDGQFSLQWDVDFTDVYAVAAIVANSANLSDPGSQSQYLFQKNCGPGGNNGLYQCGYRASANCTFSANTIACTDPVTTLPMGAVNVDFLNGQAKYVTLRVCNIAHDDCKQRAIPVNLVN